MAIVVLVVYLVKGSPRSAFAPDRTWGPGDPSVREEWDTYQYHRAFRCKQHPYGSPYGYYDNYGAMATTAATAAQPYYTYPAYHM